MEEVNLTGKYYAFKEDLNVFEIAAALTTIHNYCIVLFAEVLFVCTVCL